MLKVAEVQECKPLSDKSLLSWMSKHSESFGSSLGQKEAEHLLSIVGNDQYLLASEIEKLSTFAFSQRISVEDIDRLVLCTSERQAWALMDLMGVGNKKGALKYIEKLRYQGESAQGLWGIFLWMCSNLIGVHGAVKEGITSPPQIVKQAGVSFGAAKSFAQLARSADTKQIQKFTDRIVEYDTGIKTGAFRSTTDEEQEIQIIIELLTIDCCNLRN